MIETNTLYYGDNLTILRNHIQEDTIDLIYLDPPFNSKATYNILFKEPTGEESKAQIEAFEDTWHWTTEAERAFQEVVDTAPSNVVNLMVALRVAIHENDMMAYLTMMCIRLLELKRVLKDTGSIYLHCDPTASHYLKIVMDAVFEAKNFRNEIAWCYRGAGYPKKDFGKRHDIIFRYSKKDDYIFNLDAVREEYAEATKERFKHYIGNIRKGRDFGIQALHPLGKQPDDWWQIQPIAPSAKERLGYPTQKPEALLERIIKASSNEGDVVLDPFCGCGTALVVAERLNRKWIGIDITHLAISIMKWRLKGIFPKIQYKVIGEPVDLSGAKELANQNRYQFQWWALSLIGARPYGNKKKGADTGIDGYYYFKDKETKKVIVQVKSGHVEVSLIRDLNSVVERENAAMGFFITLENPTGPMKEEAVKKGFYTDVHRNKYPKVQILTIKDILNGKEPETPVKVPIYKSTIKGEEIEKGEQKKLS